jgi:hypothetical protein
MKRTPLLFLLCLTLLFLGLFLFEPSKAENKSTNEVPVHESFSQEGDKLRRASQEVKSSKSAGANFGQQEQYQSTTAAIDNDSRFRQVLNAGPAKQLGAVKTLSATPANPDQDQKSDITVVASYQNDTSIPLRKMKPHPVVSKSEREANKNPKIPTTHKDSPDPVVQDRFDVLTNLVTTNMPNPLLNFDGIPFPGVSCNCAPPDTNGEVGATQYVQIANEGFQVFNKTTGASQLGPVGISTIWSGFGGPCETAGSGDPILLYDQLANRWLISQFAGVGIPTDECVAVSTTSDATGSYHRYAFHLGSNFFDYPKLAVWPDAYYMAMNVFTSSGSAFLGPQPFAFDRAKMLNGLPATFITTGITGGPSEPTYLPADLDGSILPPAGAPATFIQWPGTGSYRVFHFHVDFANPLNSTFTLFASPPAAGFTLRTSGIPQLGTTSLLSPIGDRLMFRAATRFFADGHESLVSNFTVQSGGVAAVRWFELRNPTLGPVTVFQQGTYQPDTTHRWMGSAAMDQQGNLAVGYSASSSAVNPQIRYAGRLVGDPLNTLPQVEATLFAGTGSQIGTSGRWGDYSAMTIDPVDDCTFWYTQEYYATTSSFNWRTRIASFKFPGCGGTVTRTLTVASSNPSSGVSISVSPADNNGFGGGTTQFSRTYNNNTTVSLAAPAMTGGNNFQKWQRNNVDWSFSQVTNVPLDANYTMTAVYGSGLKGYWKFNENTGTTTVDSSGSGNTGTLTSGAGWGTGQSGSAVGLDGVDDYVQMGAQSTLVVINTVSFTAWIHPTGAGSHATVGGTILVKEGEYVLARFPNGTIQWGFANSNPGWLFIDTGYVAPLNQWTHVAVTYDNGTIKTYANGGLVHTFSGSGFIGDAITGQNDFRIGGRQVISQHFQGRIDEVRVYNRALSASEITELIADPNFGLKGYWKFNENTGTTTVDSSGSGNTGTLTLGAGWGTGQSGSAVSLDGVDDYVQMGAQSTLVMSNTVSFTAWIHPTGAGSHATVGGTILVKEGEYVLARFPNGTIQWGFANSNPGWLFIDTGYVAPLNQWTHIAVTYDNGTIKTYANGGLVHTFSGSGFIGDAITGQNDFRIGGRQVISQHFQGRIDEVRVYNRALIASEIAHLMGGG